MRHFGHFPTECEVKNYPKVPHCELAELRAICKSENSNNCGAEVASTAQ